MCGIVGYVGRAEAAPILLDGLRRLEYRGYDSAGLAIVDGDQIETRKCAGRIAALAQLAKKQPVQVRSASATRVGPRMANRPTRMRIRTLTPAGSWRSSTTA